MPTATEQAATVLVSFDELAALRRDAERYRFVSQLAWYVDQAAYVYDVGNQRAVWSDQRQAVDADEVEDAIDATMREAATEYQ